MGVHVDTAAQFSISVRFSFFSTTLAHMMSHTVIFLRLWPVTHHEPHCRHMPINKIFKWTESNPWSG